MTLCDDVAGLVRVFLLARSQLQPMWLSRKKAPLLRVWSLTSSTLLRFSETASFTVYGVGQWHSFEVGVAPAGGSISWSTTCLLITNYSQPPLQPWSSSLHREARAKEKNTSSCQVPTTPHYKVLINRHLHRWVKVLIWSWPQFINLNDVGALVKRLLDQLSDGTPLP